MTELLIRVTWLSTDLKETSRSINWLEVPLFLTKAMMHC